MRITTETPIDRTILDFEKGGDAQGREVNLDSFLKGLCRFGDNPDNITNHQSLLVLDKLNDGAYHKAISMAGKDNSVSKKDVNLAFGCAKQAIYGMMHEKGISRLELISRTAYDENAGAGSLINRLYSWATYGGEKLTLRNYLGLKGLWYNGITRTVQGLAESQGIDKKVAFSAFEKVGSVLKVHKRNYLAPKGECELELIFKAAYEDNADAKQLVSHLNAWAYRGGEKFTRSQYDRLREYHAAGISQRLFALADSQGVYRPEMRDALENVGRRVVGMREKGKLFMGYPTNPARDYNGCNPISKYNPSNYVKKLASGVRNGVRYLIGRAVGSFETQPWDPDSDGWYAVSDVRPRR